MKEIVSVEYEGASYEREFDIDGNDHARAILKVHLGQTRHQFRIPRIAQSVDGASIHGSNSTANRLPLHADATINLTCALSGCLKSTRSQTQRIPEK